MISTIQHINQKYSKNIVTCFSYSNIPNLITKQNYYKHSHLTFSHIENTLPSDFASFRKIY